MRRKDRWTKLDDEIGVERDDAFIQDAVVIELSAERRAAKQRREALHRQLDEGRRHASKAARRGRRSRLGRRAITTVASLVVVSLLAWNAHRPLGAPASSWLHGPADLAPDQMLFHGALIDLPPPSREEASAPLGRPAPVAVESDRFAFMLVQSESAAPVAYDPCRPIHVVVNYRVAPPEGDALLTEAIEVLQVATGLRFLIDGPTEEAPTSERPPYQPDRYPGRWAPVLLSWSDPVESPGLTGRVAGNGGSTSWSVGNDRLYVTGTVTLDGPQFGKILDERDGRAKARALLQHELAHLVGLGHVEDPTQLMNPVAVPGHVTFGAGDLTGLAHLGRGRCFPKV